MGVEAKHDIDRPCIKKFLRCSIRMSCRCVSEHWVLLCLILLLYLMFKSSPGFFAFILSSSPVIICTTLLLGVLLSHGSTNFPEVDEDEKAHANISAPKFGPFSRNIHSEAHRRFSVLSSKENTVSLKDEQIKEAIFSRVRATKHFELDDSVPLLKGVYQESEIADASDILEKTLTSIPSMVALHENVGMEEFMEDNQERESKEPFSGEVKGDDKYDNLFEVVHQSRVDEIQTTFVLCSSRENGRDDVEMIAKANDNGVLTDSKSDEVSVVSEDKQAEKPAGACRWAPAFSVRQRKKLADLKVESINDATDSQLDPSLGSPFTRVGSHDGSSGFDSEMAESSSHDSPKTDIAPVLNEIDPLLVADFPCPNPIINDDLEGHSNMSPLDSQIDSDSNDNKSKAKDDDERNVGTESTFLWTVGDEKNVMDLGYSEMERNRRLEILMVKRRSRKNIRFDLHRNFIDVSSDDFFRKADDNVVQLQPISVPRRNSFDLPSDSDETEIPGSAPSILHPRNNMFDSPFDQSDESSVPEHDNFGPQEFMAASHRNMFLRRHESFNLGSQGRHLSRFKPCFVLDAMEIEEPRASDFQRQFSDKSESKLSAVTESDIISSLADQDDHNNRIENDFNTELESPDLPTLESGNR